ncbi:hypothetical protein ACSSS7_003348 [Eimeria intestinalis]
MRGEAARFSILWHEASYERPATRRSTCGCATGLLLDPPSTSLYAVPQAICSRRQCGSRVAQKRISAATRRLRLARPRGSEASPEPVTGGPTEAVEEAPPSKRRGEQQHAYEAEEASAVVQQLLTDTAVYRDTHENLLKRVELLEKQANNEALRARHAERRRQESEEKLLVLKR